MKKTGLGRGLDVLLPETENTENNVRIIAIEEIDRNPGQPRREFDEEALHSLSESIRAVGLLQPLLVVEKLGRYEIVAGERRFRAARMAGLSEVPCIVRDFSASEQMEAALIENMQRADLNPIEEAAGIRQLMDDCHYTQEQAAVRLGKSRSAVANSLRLLNLSPLVQAYICEGRLSAGHARVLAGLSSVAQQEAAAALVLQSGMSVRQLEQYVAKPAVQPVLKPRPLSLPLELKDMETRLQGALGVRTRIQGSASRGKIILQYEHEEELERIYKIMEQLENP